jgi:NAD dependent epimerase/dehydratase family enzyme
MLMIFLGCILLSPDTVNGVAPEQVTNKEFSKQLASVLNRPHLLRIPGFGLRLLFGEFGEEMLYSQRIETDAVDKLNFAYEYKSLQPALEQIVNESNKDELL